MIETTTSRSLPERSGAAPDARPGSEKTVDSSRIASRAYELYESRGRQQGRALEDWLNAERELAGAARK
jgi:hypothetical protein